MPDIYVPESVLRQIPDQPISDLNAPEIGPRKLMSYARAARIVLGSQTQLYGPSKMPGYSFGLDAFRCIRGSKLAEDPRSVCYHCYARKNFYKTWTPVVVSRNRRHEGLEHPNWVDAMTTLIIKYTNHQSDYFRWHDSGDIMSVEHLAMVVKVCENTHWVKHWMPTHEPYMVRDFLKGGKVLPPNLCIRISADYIDKPPRRIKGLEHLPTSTTHTDKPVKMKGSIVCRSNTRAEHSRSVGFCGDCRACWSPKVKNISYPLH